MDSWVTRALPRFQLISFCGDLIYRHTKNVFNHNYEGEERGNVSPCSIPREWKKAHFHHPMLIYLIVCLCIYLYGIDYFRWYTIQTENFEHLVSVNRIESFSKIKENQSKVFITRL